MSSELRDDSGASSDDEWYSRMEAQGGALEESSGAGVQALAHHQDGEYFQKVNDVNSETAGGGFAEEDNPVWGKVLSMLANTSTNSSSPDRLCPITRSDEAALHILRAWLASKLPHSCRTRMEVEMFALCNDSSQSIFVDNCADPSVVCYTRTTPERMETSVYTPYAHNVILLDRVLNTIEAMQRSTGLGNLVYGGMDGSLYECGILTNTGTRWTAQWVENCGHYVYDAVLMHHETNPVLLVGFEHSDLREGDADIINDTWKYKSSTSLGLVQRMIGLGLCSGVRSSEGQLVSWFLTYPDGSMGMLYTLQEYRGKGLAKAVVQAVLNKHAALHAQEPRPCAPYLYIECKNEASQALFTSLGFLKCNDVVWAGLALQL